MAATVPDPDGEAFRTAARLGLTLRMHGGCAQSSMPGSPSAYEVVTGQDPAAAMREAISRAEAVITNGGEAQRLQPQPQPAQPLTGTQIKAAIHDAIKAGQLSWTGYEKDEAGKYTVPVLSPKDYQLICAIEAAYGIGITTSNNTTPAHGEKS